MINVWGRASSSNVQALMWAIGELDLPHVRHDIGFTYGGNDTAAFRAMNPNGTVPVMQDGTNTPIWETGAILRYLASTYGDDAFWPGNARNRATIDQWAEWAKINITLGFTMPIFWRVVRTAPSQHDAQAITHAVSAFSDTLEIAEQQLAKQRYLASDSFSLADIQFGHVLYRYFDIAITRRDFPHIRNYFQQLSKRPAFIKHVAISYEELRVSD